VAGDEASRCLRELRAALEARVLVYSSIPAGARVSERVTVGSLQETSSFTATRRTLMAERGKGAGLTLGGALVIAGILIVIFWSFWIGLIVALVGLVAFGGFARGRWY
jgi:CHASE2 domain-containing sensor protein